MPSRGLSIAIIVFWLGMTTWMFFQDVWPQLQPGVPPPYTIDLVDEARIGQKTGFRPREDDYPNEVRWRLFEEGSPFATSVPERKMPAVLGLACGPSVAILGPSYTDAFSARTWVVYRETPDESFAFGFMLIPSRIIDTLDFGPVKLKTLKSIYRVNRAGQLLDMEIDLKFEVALAKVRTNVDVHMDGKVHQGFFCATLRAQLPQPLGSLEHPLELVPVSHSNSVLNPLQPVNRIKGLRPGQTWRMPMIDPLGEALRASHRVFGHNEVRFLNARVLPQTQLLPNHPAPIRCLVIEYDDEDTRPRTWVQAQSGLVLRQEVTQLGKRLILQRDSIISEP